MKLGNLSKITALTVTALITACGGSGTTSLGGPSLTPTATGSTVAIGTITGFGSVFVNGVRFDVSSAQISVNGQSATQAQLKVGQVVKVRGTANKSTGQGVAQSVEFEHDLEGAITAINTTDSTLVVLGHTVKVDGSTSFDPRITGGALSGLKVGDVIEVSGLPDAAGVIHATRIELENGVTGSEARGKVSLLDTGKKQFNLDKLVVDYSTATLQNFTSGAPANDDLVKVRGTVNAAGVLVATRVERKTPDDVRGNGTEVELEGLISDFTSATDFKVNGQAVHVSATTVIKVDGNLANVKLALNVKVEVEGTVDAAGVLQATKIEIHLGAGAGLRGKVDSIDTANRKLVVLGVQIELAPMARFEDNSSLKLERFSLTDLAVGDTVQLRGAEVVTAGVSKIIASRLERVGATAEVRINGNVSAAASPQFTVVGLNIQTNATTVFRTDGATKTATEFFAAALNKNVEVKATVAGTVVTASEVSLRTKSDNDD